MMTFENHRLPLPMAIANMVAEEAASLADAVWIESDMMQIPK